MERAVSFYTGPGHRLAGIVESPDSSAGEEKRATIILCQGPGGTKEGLTSKVSHVLARAGYACLRFDYRGWGESEGPPHRVIPLEQVEDIRNAITFMQQQSDVNPAYVGLWGAATGGANVSYAAAVDPRVTCMVSVNGMGDLGRWFRDARRYWEWGEFLKRLGADRVTRVLTGKSEAVESSQIILSDPASDRSRAEREKLPQFKGRKSMITLESAEAMAAFRPEAEVNRIAPRAAMWICADLDRLLPNDQSLGMYDRAGQPKKLLVFEGDDHYDLYYGKAFEPMMAASTSWFDAHLNGT